ncbi:unnamed protein product [Anisakis simplex]|uniref:Calcium channel flower n=1 Tax=Anisakis simplex TaxID=6269 RepID=A0A0M3K5A0_ANISI|nr:unnamed protein product [Anisakis simplex]
MGAAASGAQTQMQTEHDPNAAFPWWVRFLAKGLGILGGFIAVFFAVLGLISFSATCIIAVLLQLSNHKIYRMGVIPIVMCAELNTVLGAGMIFASGTVYGFMALGKKADLSGAGAGTDPAWNANLTQQTPPSSFGNPSMA